MMLAVVVRETKSNMKIMAAALLLLVLVMATAAPIRPNSNELIVVDSPSVTSQNQRTRRANCDDLGVMATLAGHFEW